LITKKPIGCCPLRPSRAHPRAIVSLGDMYAAGLGTPRDMAKAIQLYERVAHVEFFAAVALGRIYSEGVMFQSIRSARRSGMRSRLRSKDELSIVRN